MRPGPGTRPGTGTGTGAGSGSSGGGGSGHAPASLELPRIVALVPSATGFLLTWQPPSGVVLGIVSHYKVGYGEEDIFTYEERVPVTRDKRPPYTFQARNLRTR